MLSMIFEGTDAEREPRMVHQTEAGLLSSHHDNSHLRIAELIRTKPWGSVDTARFLLSACKAG